MSSLCLLDALPQEGRLRQMRVRLRIRTIAEPVGMLHAAIAAVVVAANESRATVQVLVAERVGSPVDRCVLSVEDLVSGWQGFLFKRV